MFDIGWSELLIIGIVALIVIGPKELPTALRTLGQWMAKIRRMASEFQGQFQDAMREAELAELKKEMDEMTSKGLGHFDPIAEMGKMGDEIEKSVGELPPLDSPTTKTPTDVATAPTSPSEPSPAELPPSDASPASEPPSSDARADAKPDAGKTPA